MEKPSVFTTTYNNERMLKASETMRISTARLSGQGRSPKLTFRKVSDYAELSAHADEGFNGLVQMSASPLGTTGNEKPMT